MDRPEFTDAFINASRGVGCFMESLHPRHRRDSPIRCDSLLQQILQRFCRYEPNRRYPQYPWTSFYALDPRTVSTIPIPKRPSFSATAADHLIRLYRPRAAMSIYAQRAVS